MQIIHYFWKKVSLWLQWSIPFGLFFGFSHVLAHELDQHSPLWKFQNVAQWQNQVTISQEDGYRVITSNGLPDHETGNFPNGKNPHAIEAQDQKYRIPLSPKKNRKITQMERGTFGVAINGIAFIPRTAEYWRNDRTLNWREEAITPAGIVLGLDQNHAHVQPGGLYHYHGIPTGLVAKIKDSIKTSDQDNNLGYVLIGWAIDGFGIYASLGENTLQSSYQLKKGARSRNEPTGNYDGSYDKDYEYVANSGDLDECNGTELGGQYAYVLSDSFPFVPRCWVGEPEMSNSKPQGNQQSNNAFSSRQRSGQKRQPNRGRIKPSTY